NYAGKGLPSKLSEIVRIVRFSHSPDGTDK
ncbi:MAG: hypothetical protein ACI9J0_003490, partial [Cryomorphaceae bacterium]